MKYTLGQIAQIVNGRLNGDPDIIVEGVAIDSRLIKDNELFVPVIGERVDGHSFVSSLFEKGIKGSFWQKGVEGMPEGNLIVVDNTIAALQKLAARYRQDLGIPIVGITGSSGKTSTKDLVASVLSQKYRVHKTDGNKNNDIGVPLTLLSIQPDIEVAVIEMGILDFGIMDNLVEMVRPDHTVISSIAPAHIMRFKTMDNIVQQKCLINKYLEGTCFYNHDTYGLAEYLPEMGLKQKPVSYGFEEGSDVLIEPENFSAYGQNFRVSVYPGYTFAVPLLGVHQILNATAAILVGRQFGLTEQQISDGLENVTLTPHRSQLVRIKANVIIDDTYNSNPGSLKASLEMLSGFKNYRKKCVCLGDMLELGENEAEFHAGIADAIDFSQFDHVLLYGELMKNLHERIQSQGRSSEYYNDRDKLRERIKEIMNEQVIILFKASNGLKFMDLIQELEEYYEH